MDLAEKLVNARAAGLANPLFSKYRRTPWGASVRMQVHRLFVPALEELNDPLHAYAAPGGRRS
jgi:hypothetical protein